MRNTRLQRCLAESEAQQTKRPARGRPFVTRWRWRRSLVLRDQRSVEVIIHADLHGVEVERARVDGSAEASEVGLAAEAAVEVLALDRPLRSDEGFDASTDG